jgi:NAD(P)-dependent dehydrogenase (short-subunit alcohol dehydrogenase family)
MAFKWKDSAVGQTIEGIFYQAQNQGPVPQLKDEERLDGKTCLITGANTGLGKGIALEFARRGANVIMACRGGIPEAGEDVRRDSGNRQVEMLKVDLSSFDSVHALCDTLRDRGTRLDTIVLNAAVVPIKSKPTTQGFDLMFGVNYLANMLLIDRLTRDGVIPNRTFAQPPQEVAEDQPRPRIIIVSSEDHRRADGIVFEGLGEYYEYKGMGDIAQYGNTKLMLTAYAQELSRRLTDEKGVDVGVYTFCPGAVRSNIGREAPWILRSLLDLVMRLFFASPEQAAEPALYFAASGEVEGRTGLYFKRMMEIEPADEARDLEIAQRLWKESERLIAATQNW